MPNGGVIRRVIVQLDMHAYLPGDDITIDIRTGYASGGAGSDISIDGTRLWSTTWPNTAYSVAGFGVFDVSIPVTRNGVVHPELHSDTQNSVYATIHLVYQ